MKASANQQVIYLTEDPDVAVLGPGRGPDRPAGHRRAGVGPAAERADAPPPPLRQPGRLIAVGTVWAPIGGSTGRRR